MNDRSNFRCKNYLAVLYFVCTVHKRSVSKLTGRLRSSSLQHAMILLVVFF